ncbi:MAG TPA: diguanylate cyclase [Rhodocyclaceae bacterium]|nr:diguanylate cyclase [Rhodocyclaceae bacterium]
MTGPSAHSAGSHPTSQNVLDGIVESIICVDLQGCITYWNKGAELLYGYPRDEAIGRHFSMLYPGGREEEEALMHEMRPRLMGGERMEIEGWRVRKDGRRVFIHLAASPLWDEKGGPAGLVGFALDITARKQAEDALRERERDLSEQNALNQAMLDAQSEAGVGQIVIESGRVVFCNDAICRITGYSPEEMLHLPSFLDLCHPADRERVAFNHRRRLSGESFENRYDISVVTKFGERREVEIAVATIAGREKPAVLVVAVDITDRKLAEERVQYLALHDSLTGLANRVLFFDRLNSAIARARRLQNCFALLFLDLDDFKPINDTLGHDAGDLALRGVAERLRGCVRESDTVARVGGDEFILLVNDVANPDAALAIADKVISAITNPVRLDDHLFTLGASVGVALYPEHGMDADSLMQHADSAMYGAKRLGKNRRVLFR